MHKPHKLHVTIGNQKVPITGFKLTFDATGKDVPFTSLSPEAWQSHCDEVTKAMGVPSELFPGVQGSYSHGCTTATTATPPWKGVSHIVGVMRAFDREVERKKRIWWEKQQLREAGLAGNLDRMAELLLMQQECFERSLVTLARFHKMHVPGEGTWT